MLEGIGPIIIQQFQIFMILTQFSRPQNYTVDVIGQQLLVYDNGRPDCILLFGTDECFRFLNNSQDWFLDGTFKSSPVQFM